MSDINMNHLSLLKIEEEESKAPFNKEITALENSNLNYYLHLGPVGNIDDENFQSNFDEKKDVIDYHRENPEEGNL